MLDVTLPLAILPSGAVPSAGGVFIHDHRRATPSPRYRITFASNLISLVLAGRKSLTCAGQSGVYGPGTCVLFRKGHCLSADLCPGEEGYHSLLLFFDDSVVSAFKHKYREMLGGRPVRGSAEVGLPLPGDGFIEQFGQSLVRSFTAPGGRLTARQQALRVEEVLLHLVEREGRRIVDFLEQPADEDSDARLVRVVEQHALANLTIEDLAFLCHLSVATFKRRFGRRFGCSPGEWLRARLLEHAAFLLRQEKLDPSDVYLRVGYSGLSSFTKSFRDYHGITPKRYQLAAMNATESLRAAGG